MILDLHTHSIKSDDGRAKVQNYCQWIRARNIPIDGFVLTEHRQFDFDSDYSELARKHDLVILKARSRDRVRPCAGVRRHRGAVPLLRLHAHWPAPGGGDRALQCPPCRCRALPPGPACAYGMSAHLEEHGVPKGVRIVEIHNGGSRGDEEEVAAAMAEELGYLGIAAAIRTS